MTSESHAPGFLIMGRFSLISDLSFGDCAFSRSSKRLPDMILSLLEGFEVAAGAAQDMSDSRRTVIMLDVTYSCDSLSH